MQRIRTWLTFAMLIAAPAQVTAAPPALIEVQLGNETLQGKVIARNGQALWLMSQDGRLHSVNAEKAGKERRISPDFRGWTGSVLRDQLRREFGKSFEIVGSRHYAVCASGDQKARAYAETFEDLFRTFQTYFSVRGFKINEPEFPLIAIVFPDFESFERYARTEKVSVSRNLKGYYLSTSNRIALYDESDGGSRAHTQLLPPGHRLNEQPWFNGDEQCPFGLTDKMHASAGSIEANLKDTMIHEATHQAAFNTGLHARLGETPKWVVEGLATVFEAPGVRNSGPSVNVKTRINRERFIWFGNFAKSRRKERSLEAFLSSDEFFKTSVLDAYSQAWAFTFFLIETRPRPYADYLRTIAARDPLQAYPAETRVADFKRTVSKELPLLEAEFLRFIAGIK